MATSEESIWKTNKVVYSEVWELTGKVIQTCREEARKQLLFVVSQDIKRTAEHCGKN